MDLQPEHATAIAREYQRVMRPRQTKEPTTDAGQRYGPYVVQRELGRGAQGQVLLAHDRRTDAPVAIKRLHPALDQDARQRAIFARGFELSDRLDHPDLCRVLAKDLDGPRPFAVLEWVPGRTLRDCLRAATVRTPPRERHDTAATPRLVRPRDRREWLGLLGFIARVALAVQWVHGACIAHHDLKPANLMVTPQGDPRIIDFGIARDLRGDPERIRPDALAQGTLAYMAPEQWLAPARAGASADLFALGVITFECVTGQRPFPGHDPAQRLAAVRAGLPAAARRWMPPALHRTLARATAFAPSARQDSAAAFAAEVIEIAGASREHG